MFQGARVLGNRGRREVLRVSLPWVVGSTSKSLQDPCPNLIWSTCRGIRYLGHVLLGISLCADSKLFAFQDILAAMSNHSQDLTLLAGILSNCGVPVVRVLE